MFPVTLNHPQINYGPGIMGSCICHWGSHIYASRPWVGAEYRLDTVVTPPVDLSKPVLDLWILLLLLRLDVIRLYIYGIACTELGW